MCHRCLNDLIRLCSFLTNSWIRLFQIWNKSNDFLPLFNLWWLFHVLVTTSCSKASSFHVFCGFVGVDPVARERVSLLRKVPRGPHEGIANTVLNKRRITIDRRGNRVLRPHCFVTPERSLETTTTTSYPRLRIGKSRNKIEFERLEFNLCILLID